jgi:uridine kinase
MSDNGTYVQSVLSEHFQSVSESLSYDEAVLGLIDTIRNLPKQQTLVISLVGGAASGKSTLAQSLCDELSKIGMTSDVIATDDFNKGDRAWRRENYDDIAAIPDVDPARVDPLKLKDFDLLNRKIDEIRKLAEPGQTVAIPTYNPITGVAIDEGEENYKHRIGPVDVLFVEGDFHPVSNPDLVVFVHMPDEVRLQNRLSRDVVARAGDVARTTESFNFRQKYQHTPVTLPIIEKADIVLDVSVADTTWRYQVYTKRN